MNSLQLLWEMTLPLDGILLAARRISLELKAQKHFCLWLEGEMGAGKTTLTGEILYELGLSRLIPVTSPTYSYLNEYEIKHQRYAHADLYRADPRFAAEELGLNEGRYQGLILEWPEKIASVPDLQATHLTTIKYLQDQNLRSYTFYKL